MKINNKLVKHYIQYDITMLTSTERKELATDIKNDLVLDPYVNGIIKKDHTENSKWLVSYTRSLNQLSILYIQEY